MTKSSPDTAVTAAPARFALWPLPELPGRGGQPAGLAQASATDPAAEGYARGVQVGRAEAMAEAERTLKRAASLLVSTAEALDAARLGLVRELEDSVYLLALTVARHLVQREVIADPALVRDLVSRGLDAFPVGSRVEIHVHPEDLAVLRGQLDPTDTSGRPAEIQWIGDAEVERGGCTLVTPHRVVDGRIDLALRELYARMRND
jgi:flagellar biosynthesis/type III secretory pathway protein FliH